VVKYLYFDSGMDFGFIFNSLDGNMMLLNLFLF